MNCFQSYLLSSFSHPNYHHAQEQPKPSQSRHGEEGWAQGPTLAKDLLRGDTFLHGCDLWLMLLQEKATHSRVYGYCQLYSMAILKQTEERTKYFYRFVSYSTDLY